MLTLEKAVSELWEHLEPSASPSPALLSVAQSDKRGPPGAGAGGEVSDLDLAASSAAAAAATAKVIAPAAVTKAEAAETEGRSRSAVLTSAGEELGHSNLIEEVVVPDPDSGSQGRGRVGRGVLTALSAANQEVTTEKKLLPGVQPRMEPLSLPRFLEHMQEEEARPVKATQGDDAHTPVHRGSTFACKMPNKASSSVIFQLD